MGLRDVDLTFALESASLNFDHGGVICFLCGRTVLTVFHTMYPCGFEREGAATNVLQKEASLAIHSLLTCYSASLISLVTNVMS